MTRDTVVILDYSRDSQEVARDVLKDLSQAWRGCRPLIIIGKGVPLNYLIFFRAWSKGLF